MLRSHNKATLGVLLDHRSQPDPSKSKSLQEDQTGLNGYKVLLGSAISACVLMLLCILFANRRGFWLDEYITFGTLSQPWRSMVASRFEAGHSPLFFLYARIFALFGESERILRLSTILPAGITVFAATLLALELGFDRRKLISLWFVCAISPVLIENALIFRYMSPLICVSAFCMWATLWHSRRRNIISSLVLTLLFALLLWIHFSACFLLPGLIAYSVWDLKTNGNASLKDYVLRLTPLVAGFVLSVPFVVLISAHSSEMIKQSPDFVGLILSPLHTALGDPEGWATLLGFSRWIAAALFLILLVFVFRIGCASGVSSPYFRSPLSRFLSSVVGTTLVILIAVQILGNPYELEPRYIAWLSIPFIIALANFLGEPAVINHPRMRKLRPVLFGLTVVQCCFALLSKGDCHQEAVRWVVANNTHPDPLFITLTIANQQALDWAGYNGPLVKHLKSRTKDSAVVQQWIEKGLKDQLRAFVLVYKGRSPVEKTLRQMAKKDQLFSVRRWKLSGMTTVFALSRNPADKEWLQSLEFPRSLFIPVRERWFGWSPEDDLESSESNSKNEHNS